jgi:hypothetical protein
MKELIAIQSKLKAPKNQFNSFGDYKYRSCEDILEAVKPLCVAEGVLLTITDEVIGIGNRVYIKATATVTKGDVSLSVSAYAREAENKKGMDDSQITGSASSYARKYALNGLFLIDDTRDADTRDNSQQEIAYITDEQKSTLLDMIADTESDMDKFLAFLKVDELTHLPQSKYKAALVALNKKKEAK